MGLAWLIKHGNKLLDGAGVVPIPGSRSAKHIAENAAAIALADTLTDDDMAKIEEAFPKELYSKPRNPIAVLSTKSPATKSGKVWFCSVSIP